MCLSRQNIRQALLNALYKRSKYTAVFYRYYGMCEQFDIALFDKRLAIFKEQINVLREAFRVQNALKHAVYEKKWTDFEALNQALAAALLELEQSEARRRVLFDPEQCVSAPRFYLYAAGLPQKEREDITGAYRTLKMETAKLRLANLAFQNYIKEIGDISKSFLDAAFPDRRGSLYGRRGAIRGADMRSIVLDKQF